MSVKGYRSDRMATSAPVQRVLGVARLIAAAALLLRIGGYGAGVIPPALVCLAILVALVAAGRWADAVQLRGRAHAAADLRAWASENSFWLTLSAVALLAAVVRLAAITQDLGHVAPGIDENRLNSSILFFFRTGEIDHRTVEHYPGVHFWLLTGSYLLAYLRGLTQGLADTFAGMPREVFFAAGRLVSTAESVATVVLVGLLGRRLAGARTGLWAAGLLALAPLSISLGRQLRNDAAQTMLIVAAVYVALGVYRRGHSGYAPLLAGALAGLAAGVKYTGVFALIPVLLAAVSTEDTARRGRASVLALGGFVAAALTSNHFVVTDLPRLVYQLSSQIQITGPLHWAAQDNPAAFHVMILATRVVGWPLLILGAATLVVHLAAGRWRWWVFAAYPLVYIGFVSGRPSQLPRWVYPAAPFAAIIAAAGLVAVTAYLGRRMDAADRPRLAWAAGPILAFILVSPVVWRTATELNRRFGAPTYRVAEEWLEHNTAAGDRILIQRRWLDLDPKRFSLNRVASLQDQLDGGRHALAANDWIVVHEALRRHSTLEALTLGKDITVDAFLGGNQGPDFAIYAAPRIAATDAPLDLRLDTDEAFDFLGPEWSREPDPRPGLALPPAGASLFLPPLGSAGRTLDIVVAAADDDDDAASLVLDFESAGRALIATRISVAPNGAQTFTMELSLRVVGPGVVRVFVRPGAGAGPVRVLRIRLR